MLRYHLDDLGPYQFEKLTQSALKAALGLGVESWGNRGDWGRDSYSRGPLRYPDPKDQTKECFVSYLLRVLPASEGRQRDHQDLLKLLRGPWVCPIVPPEPDQTTRDEFMQMLRGIGDRLSSALAP